MKSNLSLIILVLAIAANTSQAHAGNYSMSGGACFVDDTATTGTVSRNAAFAGLVEFGGSSTGTIRLLCQIINTSFGTNSGSFTSLNFSYYDTDGTTDTCYLKAYLNQTPVNSTSGATDYTYDGTADTGLANSSPFFDWRVNTFFPAISVNFATNYYWLDVDLVRGSTSCNVSLVGFTIGT
jgi:hypothetical protein